MGKVFQSPFRAVGAVLALVGAAIAIVFVPIASAHSPSGPDQVTRYFLKSGPTNKVGLNQIFGISGKNLEFADTVECWDPTFGDWHSIDFEIVSSKALLAVIGDPDCLGKSRIRVDFDNTDPLTMVVGPLLKVT